MTDRTGTETEVMYWTTTCISELESEFESKIPMSTTCSGRIETKIFAKIYFRFLRKKPYENERKEQKMRKMNMVNVFTISPLLTDFFKNPTL